MDSGSTQSTKGKRFSREESMILFQICNSTGMKDLAKTAKQQELFERISLEMLILGYNRDWKQCMSHYNKTLRPRQGRATITKPQERNSQFGPTLRTNPVSTPGTSDLDRPSRSGEGHVNTGISSTGSHKPVTPSSIPVTVSVSTTSYATVDPYQPSRASVGHKPPNTVSPFIHDTTFLATSGRGRASESPSRITNQGNVSSTDNTPNKIPEEREACNVGPSSLEGVYEVRFVKLQKVSWKQGRRLNVGENIILNVGADISDENLERMSVATMKYLKKHKRQ